MFLVSCFFTIFLQAEDKAIAQDSVIPNDTNDINVAREENKKRLIESNQCLGCDLVNQDLSGLNLRNANLSKALLQDANLTGSDLRGAVLIKAKLCRAKLVNTDLRGANLSYANFTNANLTYAKLSNKTYVVPEQISIENCPNCRSYLRTKAYKAIFNGARLDDTDVEGLGSILESKSALNNADTKATIVGPWLVYASFNKAMLRRSNLKKVDLFRANMSDANLSGVTGADLHDFKLFGKIGSDLEGANLTEANLSRTDFRGSNLKESQGAILDTSATLRAILPNGDLDVSNETVILDSDSESLDPCD